MTDPSEGPCGDHNGGCDHICNADSGIVKCFCRVGYFSIAFLPTKCFGNTICTQCIYVVINICNNLLIVRITKPMNHGIK